MGTPFRTHLQTHNLRRTPNRNSFGCPCVVDEKKKSLADNVIGVHIFTRLK